MAIYISPTGAKLKALEKRDSALEAYNLLAHEVSTSVDAMEKARDELLRSAEYGKWT